MERKKYLLEFYYKNINDCIWNILVDLLIFIQSQVHIETTYLDL